MLRRALWPSIALATAGVATSAGVAGAAVVLLFGVPWPEALLLGAATAPTDAAAVILRLSGARVPSRVVAALEVESGLNDPMSVFITVALVSAGRRSWAQAGSWRCTWRASSSGTTTTPPGNP